MISESEVEKLYRKAGLLFADDCSIEAVDVLKEIIEPIRLRAFAEQPPLAQSWSVGDKPACAHLKTEVVSFRDGAEIERCQDCGATVDSKQKPAGTVEALRGEMLDAMLKAGCLNDEETESQAGICARVAMRLLGQGGKEVADGK